MKNVILITGGAGFIGANFARMIYESTSNHLLILDKLTYAGDIRRLDPLLEDRERVSFIKGDICDREFLADIFQKHQIDQVAHFAAESHVDRSIHGPDAFLQTNVNGTVNLLTVSKNHWEDNYEEKLFLHVSTDEVFGSLGPEDAPFTENSRFRPNSPYSASKAASDLFVRSWIKTYDFPAIITNCSNNYGPWQFPEKLLPLMIQNALERKSLPIYGDGGQVRDWIHVEDHCRALLAIMEKGSLGETYLIGAGQEKRNIDIVMRICEIIDSMGGNFSKNLIQYIADRPGHDWRYAIDSTKLQTELDWKPIICFDQALEEYVRWVVEHRVWMESVRDQTYRDYYKKHYERPL
jgi:dTDP-glucose 4,6-dehydratase